MNIHQPDSLFPETVPHDPVLGLAVDLPTGCRRCRGFLATIGEGKRPHAAALYCNGCGIFRGWVSRETHRFLTENIKFFGRPTEPVAIRLGAATSDAAMTRAALDDDQ